MTDFVFKQDCDALIGQRQAFLNIVNYAEFITQPLELWMFVPCVDNEVFNYSKHGNKEQYNEAKEICLFNGVTEDYVYFIIKTYRNIEGLLDVTFDLTLTETAKNMFK